jgi:hypothetical protein
MDAWLHGYQCLREIRMPQRYSATAAPPTKKAMSPSRTSPSPKLAKWAGAPSAAKMSANQGRRCRALAPASHSARPMAAPSRAPSAAPRPLPEGPLEGASDPDQDHADDGAGPRGLPGEHQRRAAERAEDEGDGGVAGEHRADHADRDEHRAHQPVAEVGREHQAGVGVAEVGEHQHVRQAEQQADGVDPERAEELAEHDLAVADRQRQQQLIGAGAALVGPQAHRDGRDEEHEDRRHPRLRVARSARLRPKNVSVRNAAAAEATMNRVRNT